MRYIISIIAFCLLILLPQETFSAVSVAVVDKDKTSSYQDMSKAEKKAIRKDLRKKIKAAKKANAPQLEFDNYRVMGVSLSLIGLAGIVVGSVVGIGILNWLGGLVLTAGLVILILYWLDVI